MIEAWCDRKNGELKKKRSGREELPAPQIQSDMEIFAGLCQKDIIGALEAGEDRWGYLDGQRF